MVNPQCWSSCQAQTSCFVFLLCSGVSFKCLTAAVPGEKSRLDLKQKPVLQCWNKT